MNWLAKKLGNRVVITLLSVVFFVSCKKEKDPSIGLVALPQELPIGTYFIDTISVNTSTILVNDSIPTNNSGVLMIGAYSDAEFGDVSTEVYTRVTLKEENKSFTGATINSATLYIDYTSAYGDTLQNQTLNVYQLTEAYNNALTYYSSSAALAYDPTVRGTLTFQARPVTGTDLAISLDNTIALDILSKAGGSNDNFESQFPGIAILPQNNDEGAVLLVNLDPAKTFLKIIYTQSAVVDSIELSIQSNKGYTRIYSDRSATALAPLMSTYDEVSSSLTSNKLYFQAGTGVKTKLTFPYLSTLKTQLGGSVVINRAELILPTSAGSNTSLTQPTSVLLFETDASNYIKRNSAGQALSIKNSSSSFGSTLFEYSEASQAYVMNITDYFQAIVNNQKENTGVMVSPNLNNISVRRAVLNDRTHLTAPSKATGKLYPLPRYKKFLASLNSSETSMICSLTFRASSTFAGRFSKSTNNSMYFVLVIVPFLLATIIDIIAKTVTWAVNAFVLATPISGPACKYAPSCDALAIEEPTALQTPKIIAPFDLANSIAAKVSAVSPD